MCMRILNQVPNTYSQYHYLFKQSGLDFLYLKKCLLLHTLALVDYKLVYESILKIYHLLRRFSPARLVHLFRISLWLTCIVMMFKYCYIIRTLVVWGWIGLDQSLYLQLFIKPIDNPLLTVQGWMLSIQAIYLC